MQDLQLEALGGLLGEVAMSGSETSDARPAIGLAAVG
jgi:hypothetical protein